MRAHLVRSTGWALFVCVACASCSAENIETGVLDTKLVPWPLQYSVPLPESYAASGKTYPVFFFLHVATD